MWYRYCESRWTGLYKGLLNKLLLLLPEDSANQIAAAMQLLPTHPSQSFPALPQQFPTVFPALPTIFPALPHKSSRESYSPYPGNSRENAGKVAGKYCEVQGTFVVREQRFWTSKSTSRADP
jgi:hypothetical protein